MLPTLQYTDFHKFLVSVGGLSCGVGAGLPVVLLRSQSVFKVTQKQLIEMTPEGQKATKMQQGQVAFLLHTWPYISTFLILVGLGLIVWGAVRWKKQQNRTDSREVAEVAKLETGREKTYQETLILLREHQEPPDVADSVREDKATSEVLSEESGKNQATQEAGPGDIAEPYEPKLRPTRGDCVICPAKREANGGSGHEGLQAHVWRHGRHCARH